MEDENFNKFCSQIDASAFLPPHDVSDGMRYLKGIASEEEQKLIIDYFECTYVTGTYKMVPLPSINSFWLRRIPPAFPPKLWNVHNATVQGSERTNNDIEGWNNRF